MIYMKINTNVWHDVKICPSDKNEGLVVVDVDESSKSYLYDDGEACEWQVGDHLVANEDAI